MKWLICIILVALTAPHAHAKFLLDTPLENTSQEQRAQALFNKVRCKVCDGQDISSSGAELAVAMRRVIREQIKSGQNDHDILTYLTSRYGEDVLLDPPATHYNSVLWIAPLLLLLLGFGLIWRMNQSNS